MNRHTLTLLAGLLATPVLMAQPSPSSSSPVQETEDEAIELSPFVVDASQSSGYFATNTLAGTRLNTPVKDLGSSISIYTKDFLQDVGATDASQLLVYATGMEAAGPFGNFSGAAGSISSDQLNPNGARLNPQQSRTRGLSSPEFTRGFFLSDIPMDSYNVGEVTVNRGPNAILFGVGSPAGVVDAGLIRAHTNKTQGEFEVRYGNNDAIRARTDINYVLVEDKVAARLALLEDREKYNQEPAFEKDRRVYAALTAKPWKTGEFRVSFEKGRIRANRPISTLPYNSISSYWFEAGRPSIDWRFFDDPALNPDAPNQPTDYGLIMNQRNIFDNMMILYQNPTDQAPSAGFRSRVPGTGGTAANSYLINSFHPDVNRDAANDEIQFYTTLALPLIPSQFWVGDRVFPGQQPGFAPAGLKYQGFTDFSAFDFRNRMIDETSFQRNDFDALNLTFEQRAWENRVGIELSYDKQRHDNWAKNSFFSTNNANHILMDVNVTLPNGQPNPNLGRPYVVYNQANWDNGQSEREAWRATGFINYDFEDLNETVGKWLGQHTATVLYERNARDSVYYGTRLAADGPAARGMDPNIQSFARRAGILAYIGPSVIGNDDPLSLVPLRIGELREGPTTDVTMFFRESGATDLGGFETTPASLVEINNGGRAFRDVIESYAAVLKSDWLRDHVTTIVGWRRDKDYFVSRNIGFISNPADRNDPGKVHFAIGDFDFPSKPGFNIGKDIWSYSVVARWPEELVKLPDGVDLSLFYNKSENFTPLGGRTNAYGEPLSSPQGETEEYGFNLSLLDDRFSARVNWFETSNVGQTATSTAFAEGTHNGIAQIVTFWALEANTNPENAVFMNQAIETLLSPLPDNFLDLYGVQISGTAPNITTSLTGLNSRADTTDYTAEGLEAEFVYNPAPNWRILFNVAKQETVETNSAPGLKELVQRMGPVWEELADIPRTGYPLGYGPNNPPPAATQTLGQFIEAQVLIPYATVLAAEGSASAEQRKWRANFVTNYTFDDGDFGGRLKGWSVGGAIRWEDKLGIGYPTARNADGSVNVDIGNPYFAPAITSVDAWLGYTRSIMNGKASWSVRLSGRNLIGEDDAVPVTVQPWGDVATARVPAERRWYLSSTLSF